MDGFRELAGRESVTICPVSQPDQRLPTFNNRDASYRLVEHRGRTAIAYRRPGGLPYSDQTLEAAAILQANPFVHIPRIYDVQPDCILAEYLEGFGPLSKVGITSPVGLFTKRPRRFKRWRIRSFLVSAAEHFDLLIQQLEATGQYLKSVNLWHDDVIRQNIMWHPEHKSLRLVDISAFVHRRHVDSGARPPYNQRRGRGVYRLDYSLDLEYIHAKLLQDLEPLPVILLRKLGFFKPDRYDLPPEDSD